ncbi:MAG: PASTA domain-containing protein, partial [Planctomycetia bacterium]
MTPSSRVFLALLLVAGLASRPVLLAPAHADAPAGPRTVPDVVGLAQADAERMLKDASFEVAVEQVPSPGAKPGTVLAQDPGGRTTREAGSKVTIRVAVAPAPVEPEPAPAVPAAPPSNPETPPTGELPALPTEATPAVPAPVQPADAPPAEAPVEAPASTLGRAGPFVSLPGSCGRSASAGAGIGAGLQAGASTGASAGGASAGCTGAG